MERLQVKATELVNDERVRATRFEFKPGAETGWHIHEYDYLITAITICTMQIEEPGGVTRDVTVARGETYRRHKGVKHNVINNGSSEMIFVEVEIK